MKKMIALIVSCVLAGCLAGTAAAADVIQTDSGIVMIAAHEAVAFSPGDNAQACGQCHTQGVEVGRAESQMEVSTLDYRIGNDSSGFELPVNHGFVLASAYRYRRWYSDH